MEILRYILVREILEISFKFIWPFINYAIIERCLQHILELRKSRKYVLHELSKTEAFINFILLGTEKKYLNWRQILDRSKIYLLVYKTLNLGEIHENLLYRIRNINYLMSQQNQYETEEH